MTMRDEARAFVVQRQGRWTATDETGLRRRLKRQRLLDDGATLGPALQAAQAWFAEGEAHLFVCGGRPCGQRSRDFTGLVKRVDGREGDGQPLPDPSTGVREPPQGERGGRPQSPPNLRVTMTACQGPCKQAPVATLRVGERCTMFAQVHEACDWEAVLDYAGRAAGAGTLLVDPAEAQTYLFDPVHEGEGGSGRQQRLAFLIGHFAGDGRHADGTGGFHKEVIGSWEAGGRFVGLRMAVTYVLDDQRSDVHHALVLVGYNDAAGAYEARAYMDGGTTRDFALSLEGDRLVFDDRVPGHGVNAARARKVLVPRVNGYDEVLELQAEGEGFREYSTVELRERGKAGDGS